MDVIAILAQLEKRGSRRNREGMARFGINVEKAYGTSVVEIRKLAKGHRRDHELALSLWETGVHEARLLACFVDEPAKVTEAQMDAWVLDFNSWDICDQCCSNLFDKTPFARKKLIEWTRREETFVKRAGFVLMCALSVHDKKAQDNEFESYLPLIKREATDERNFVRKAVNWALRQIGKRNRRLNRAAIAAAKQIQKLDSKAARWIAADALRELQGSAVQERLA